MSEKRIPLLIAAGGILCLLLQRVLSDTDPMPAKGARLTDAEIGTIEAWIKNGALEN